MAHAAIAEEIQHYQRSSPLLLAEQKPLQGKRPDFLPEEIWKSMSDHLSAKLNSLYAWRQTWWSTNYNDICRYIAPRRSLLLTQGSGGIPTPNSMMRGVPINNQIVDPTATLALRYCAGGMASNLAGPQRPWFKIIPLMQGITLDDDARKWVENTENRIYGVLNISNFYNQFVQECEDIAAYGTSPAIIYEDEENIIRVHVPCIGEYYLDVDASQRVIGLYRLILMTVEQQVDFFGIDNVTKEVAELWKGKGAGLQSERIIAHAVEPNYAVGTNKDWKLPGKFPWREVYWSYGDAGKQPLSIRGFWDKPFSASRWSTQGNDPYGRSQGMDVLPDVKQLQVMTRRMAEAIEKMVRPPLIADEKLKNQPASGLPGHVTFMPGLDQHNGMRSIYNVNPDVKALAENIEKISQRIDKGFFKDIFMAISTLQGDQRTATEIQARRAEAMQVLGPVVENIITENLRPKLKRIYSIMMRKKLIDPMPKSLQGQPLGFDFVSTLALAQKAASIGAMERMAALIGNLTPVFPEARDKFNVDDYIDEAGAMLGTPATIIFDADHVAQIRQQRAQQQQAVQAQQHMAQAATTANTGAQAAQVLSQTTVGSGKNALEQLTGG
jgi:hypothetical protein